MTVQIMSAHASANNLDAWRVWFTLPDRLLTATCKGKARRRTVGLLVAVLTVRYFDDEFWPSNLRHNTAMRVENRRPDARQVSEKPVPVGYQKGLQQTAASKHPRQQAPTSVLPLHHSLQTS